MTKHPSHRASIPLSFHASNHPAFHTSIHPLISFFGGKKVFLTGVTGFKGAWLARVLLNAGAKVTGYALEPPTKPSLFELIHLKKQIHSIKGDIRDLSSLKRAVKNAKPEIVIHMAAQALVRESYKNPVYTYQTNVMGTVNLLESCRGIGSIRSIVNVTTDKVYENTECGLCYKEDQKLCGYDPYSNSKSCSELVTRSYRDSFYCSKGAPAVSTARSGNVIGGGDFSKDRLIPDCVRAAIKGKKVIVRNPASVRPYQYILDCLSGYLLLAKKQYDKKYQGSYNFGPDKGDTVINAALVRMFCDEWGNGMAGVNKSDNGPHEAKFLRLDTDKAKKKLGWNPGYNIKKAVKLAVQWYREYAEKGDILGCMDRQISGYFRKG